MGTGWGRSLEVEEDGGSHGGGVVQEEGSEAANDSGNNSRNGIRAVGEKMIETEGPGEGDRMPQKQ